VDVTSGNGFAAGNLDAMGEGAGFRKIRRELDVKELGVNAIVLPAGYGTGTHWHDEQEELYFVHQGTVQFTLGKNNEETVTLGPGGVIRVDAPTERSIKNVGDVDAVYVAVGSKGGYVGRDAHAREGEARVRPPQ
jgi:mannose-6-phosphate isomerase-like protein (cupin superfamily)